MDDATKKILLTLAAGALKKGGLAIGMAAATHGYITGSQVELFGAAAVALGTAAYSFWNDYGKAIVLSQLEVLKAKSLAQAAKMKDAGVPPVTINQIANQSEKLSPEDVSKAVAKLPTDIQATIAPTVAKIMLAAVMLSALFFCHPASAATNTQASLTDQIQKLMDDIASKKAEFVSGVITAIQEADDDAATLTNPSDATSFRDPIAHACYPAQIKFLNSLPQIQAIKSPAPYNLIVLFQRKRDLVAQIKAGLPSYLKVGCSALLTDEKTILVQTLGLIGVTAAGGVLTGLFPATAPLTIPALTLPVL